MIRWNTLLLGTTDGRAALVAEALTITIPACPRSGMTAFVSPENAGPTIPRTELSGMNLSFWLVACSGGVDSCLLAVVAHQELGPSALVVTAVSPAVPGEEVARVEALAGQFGFRWRAVETAELARPGYVANAGDRCYHCRSELFDVLGPVAAAEGP